LKKTFKLQVENKNKDRVLESIKNEIRKYIKREQSKPLPEEMNYWYFDCKFAKDSETPTEIPFTAIIKCVDDASVSNCETFYLEINSIAKHREKKVKVIQKNDETIESEEIVDSSKED